MIKQFIPTSSIFIPSCKITQYLRFYGIFQSRLTITTIHGRLDPPCLRFFGQQFLDLVNPRASDFRLKFPICSMIDFFDHFGSDQWINSRQISKKSVTSTCAAAGQPPLLNHNNQSTPLYYLLNHTSTQPPQPNPPNNYSGTPMLHNLLTILISHSPPVPKNILKIQLLTVSP